MCVLVSPSNLERCFPCCNVLNELLQPRLSFSAATREAQTVKMGLRWWRDVLIRTQPKRYLDDR
jgi:hypothetical protein